MTSLRTASKHGRREWRRECKEWKRAYGQGIRNPESLAMVARLGVYWERYTSEVLAPLWYPIHHYAAYFKAVRIGRQACFILAGIHLATQRRAART